MAKKKGWPLVGIMAGCPPAQVAQFEAHDAKHGVKTQYTKNGEPIWRSREHQHRWLKAHGMANLDDIR